MQNGVRGACFAALQCIAVDADSANGHIGIDSYRGGIAICQRGRATLVWVGAVGGV